MLRIILPLLITVLFDNAYSQSFVWAKSLGGTKSEFPGSIATDPSGCVFTIGTFEGTADFDPGVGVSNLTAASRSDAFVSKLDPSGNFVWAKRIGGNNWDDGTSIAIDAAGNVYLGGHFNGTADFDPGPGTFNLSSNGDYDVYLCKLDGAGNFIWAKNFGNNNGDYCWDIVVDGMSNVYYTGQFFGTVDFNPGPGTSNMTSAGGYDFYIGKLDASGNFLWAKSLGGLNPDVSYSIDVDALGNVFASGGFNGTVDFNPGPGTNNLTSNGSEDVFVLKLDPSGNFSWARSFGGNNFDSANSIKVDNLGNIITLGTFEGTADFDPGAGINNLTSSGFDDVFISKIDNTGNFVWAKNISGVDYEDAYAINTDINGSVVFSGCLSSTVDFNPGAGIFNLTPSGTQDIFISMLDQSGNFLWASLLEGNNNFGCGSSIAIDGSNNIYTTGFYSSTVDFNPMAPVINISAAGQTDIFVHKMNYIGTPLPIELVSFNGENLGNTNILKWSTRSEVNNDYFSLLKSSDGINFEKIGIVSGAGNSSQVLNYSFIDNTPFDGITYYRLQQTDYDGQSSFSPIIALKQIFAEVNPISISPIPSSDFIHLEFSGQEFDFSLELYDVTGLCIYKSRNERVINLTTISSGAYFLKIFNEENSWTKKIIKN